VLITLSVILGLGLLLFCGAELWVISQFETPWLWKLLIIICGVAFAVALLLIGYGSYKETLTYVVARPRVCSFGLRGHNLAHTSVPGAGYANTNSQHTNANRDGHPAFH
jgi:hypothetical protein